MDVSRADIKVINTYKQTPTGVRDVMEVELLKNERGCARTHTHTYTHPPHRRPSRDGGRAPKETRGGVAEL